MPVRGLPAFAARAGTVAAGSELVDDLNRAHLGVKAFEGEPDNGAA